MAMFACCSVAPNVIPLTPPSGSLPQGNQLHQDVSERTRATSRRILYPELLAPSKHCRLLPPGTSQSNARSLYLHGILRWRGPRTGDQEPHSYEEICRGGVCVENLLAISHSIIPLSLWR